MHDRVLWCDTAVKVAADSIKKVIMDQARHLFGGNLENFPKMLFEDNRGPDNIGELVEAKGIEVGYGCDDYIASSLDKTAAYPFDAVNDGNQREISLVFSPQGLFFHPHGDDFFEPLLASGSIKEATADVWLVFRKAILVGLAKARERQLRFGE